MEVAEPFLYHEVNKLRQQQSFRDRNRYPGPDLLAVPPPVVQKQVKQITSLFYSEREIIRLLLKYGSLELQRTMRPEDGQEEITTVSDFIVREIQEDELISSRRHARRSSRNSGSIPSRVSSRRQAFCTSSLSGYIGL